MKSPLRYQVTRFDCGTTSLVNALLYLFERDEIPPDVVRYVTMVTLDQYVDAATPGGTSATAFAFLAHWLSDYARARRLPIRCEALSGAKVCAVAGSPLMAGLEAGAVAVAGCCLGADHYVLMTGLEHGRMKVFDPYYDTWPLHELDVEVRGVEPVEGRPFECNRLVEPWVLDMPAGTPYSLEAASGRDAVLLWRTDNKGCAYLAQALAELSTVRGAPDVTR